MWVSSQSCSLTQHRRCTQLSTLREHGLLHFNQPPASGEILLIFFSHWKIWIVYFTYTGSWNNLWIDEYLETSRLKIHKVWPMGHNRPAASFSKWMFMECSHTHVFMYFQLLLSYSSIKPQLWQRLKYLLYCPLQKKTVEPWIEIDDFFIFDRAYVPFCNLIQLYKILLLVCTLNIKVHTRIFE